MKIIFRVVALHLHSAFWFHIEMEMVTVTFRK